MLVVVAVIWMRELWRKPLFSSAVLAGGMDLAFILYHGNFQPRYYLVVAMPLVIVVVMSVEELRRKEMKRTAIAAGFVLLGMALMMTVRTVGYAMHPAYTHRDMAMAVAERMRADGSVAPVLYGGGGDDISLFTGVRAIAFYQPYGLQPLLDRYQPGWMGAWMDWDEDFVRQVSPEYALEPVASFRVYEDQPKHRVFVLYRMVPRGSRPVGIAK
jgi:hypothetical protein